jgi:hypothetical protein
MVCLRDICVNTLRKGIVSLPIIIIIIIIIIIFSAPVQTGPGAHPAFL